MLRDLNDYEDFVCRECGGHRLEIRRGQDDQLNLTCKDCNAVRAVISSQKELMQVVDMMVDLGYEGNAYINYISSSNGKALECSKCHTRLANLSQSFNPKYGYDLAFAKYCPECGARFVNFVHTDRRD